MRSPSHQHRNSRRDWFRIIRDLNAARISTHEIGRACGRDHQTVRLWAEGSEPKESDARIVLALYAHYCPLKYLDHQREFEIKVGPIDIERPEVVEAKKSPADWRPTQQKCRGKWFDAFSPDRKGGKRGLRTLQEIADLLKVDMHTLKAVMVSRGGPRKSDVEANTNAGLSYYDAKAVISWWRSQGMVGDIEGAMA